MVDATTVHTWMVAPARRRAAAPALARQPAWPAAGTSTRLGLSHPQTHPAVPSTICPPASLPGQDVPVGLPPPLARPHFVAGSAEHRPRILARDAGRGTDARSLEQRLEVV